MTRTFTNACVLAMLLMASCSKDQNAPTSTLPLNTFQAEANGKAFPVDLSKTYLVVTRDHVGHANTVTLTATSANGAEELFVGAGTTQVGESVEVPHVFDQPSGPNGNVSAYYQFSEGSGAIRYWGFNCSCNYTFKLDIQTVNPAKQTMSGTFSGNVCKGGCTLIRIENGKFNLPYTVKP